MDTKEYQKLAARTECDQFRARTRLIAVGEIGDGRVKPTRFMHAALGMINELGEFAKVLIKWVYYGQKFDRANLKEEIGDLMWHIAQACNAAGLDLGEIMEANIRKLRERFPERFDEELVKDENRDLDREMKAVMEVDSEGEAD